MRNNDLLKWEQVFYILEALKSADPVHIELLFRVSKRLNIEPETLYCLVKLYTFKSKKDEERN